MTGVEHTLQESARIKLIYYKGNLFRSSWEVYIAKCIEYSNMRYLYEPQKFNLAPDLNYIPDFFLISMKVWLEVKGRLRYWDAVKIKLFRRIHTLIYIGKDELKFIYGKSPGGISSLDIVNYIPNKVEVESFQEFMKRSVHDYREKPKW